MIYTAITRARKRCTVIEAKTGLFEKCANMAIKEYYGNLEEQLQNIQR